MNPGSTYSAFNAILTRKEVIEVETKVEVQIDSSSIDEFTEKVSRLNEMLEKTISLISSLGEKIKA